MTTTQPLSAATIPGYLAGTWQIDTVHSDVVIHRPPHDGEQGARPVHRVRGHDRDRREPAATPRVTATIKLDSIDTRNEQRDDHIRSADFFEVETYPTMTYRSTGLVANGDGPGRSTAT